MAKKEERRCQIEQCARHRRTVEFSRVCRPTSPDATVGGVVDINASTHPPLQSPSPARRVLTGTAPRNSEFLTSLNGFNVFFWRDFKPQKLLLLGGFKIQLVVQHVVPMGFQRRSATPDVYIDFIIGIPDLFKMWRFVASKTKTLRGGGNGGEVGGRVVVSNYLKLLVLIRKF